ncbi:SGNH/GDSL hydrolase family protein [Isosphaeraceae bacterium EP7]
MNGMMAGLVGRRRRIVVVGVALIFAGFMGLQAMALPQKAAEPTDLHVGSLRVNKILFLGNSITLHGPKPDIGWTGNWGMAASEETKDYVHLLTATIATKAKGQPRILAKNIADFERGFQSYRPAESLKSELEFKADLVVLAIGENVPALTSDALKTEYGDAFRSLISAIQGQGKPTIVVRSCFWADPAKDEIMRSICKEMGGLHVDLGKLGADPQNMAGAERKIDHAGVANHPGDRGMQAIAEAIWAVIRERGSK